MLRRVGRELPIGIATAFGMLVIAGSVSVQAASDHVQAQKLTVKAFIGELCSVTAASLDFGDGVSHLVTTHSTGSIDITCATDTLVKVKLNGGQQPGGGPGNRTMKGSGTDLLYVLYSGGQQNDPWETNEEVQANITGGSGSVPVYGTIPAQANGQGPGLYTDDVIITLNF